MATVLRAMLQMALLQDTLIKASECLVVLGNSIKPYRSHPAPKQLNKLLDCVVSFLVVLINFFLQCVFKASSLNFSQSVTIVFE